MRIVFEGHLRPGWRVLDVGSADGPSVGWLDELGTRIAVDLDPRGLDKGGICASGDRLPFGDKCIDCVSAFDVIEHFADENSIVAELQRVLRPAGVLLISVPAYRWAWSGFDVRAGHHRRYTRGRVISLLRRHGFTIVRATYAFAGTFPLFAVDRLRARALGRRGEGVADSRLSPRAEEMLMSLSKFDSRALSRVNLPFGSSIFVVARKPA